MLAQGRAETGLSHRYGKKWSDDKPKALREGKRFCAKKVGVDVEEKVIQIKGPRLCRGTKSLATTGGGDQPLMP
jgi:hypothetical protein